MFTAQDILDIAIRLEKNGEKTYRDARLHISGDALKTLLAWIAQEEHNHARWFTELKNRLTQGEDHHLMAELSRALVEDVIQGQAFSLEEVDFETIDSPDKMLRTFIGFEDDTIAFYEVLKTFIDETAIAAQLEQIILEEKKHMATFQEMLAGD
ncbi:ferritin family protein [Desulfosarcina sp.]|jgi:rubrerythrin|uniref:ferritin-like domain-containing protein n=1 Tax=Desulfosarcina sp. TaxID=2027861 RepID=UPI0029BBF8C4|nr:ferritin family protein [Desulfosarcina sp.]MDX2453057.1 ferritin family protein [Desulfosarcina sp.]MDX2490799.1 ferritin family protein [Desulfosarcina sp.]